MKPGFQPIKIKSLSYIKANGWRRTAIFLSIIPMTIANMGLTLLWVTESLVFLVTGMFSVPYAEWKKGRPCLKYLVLSPLFFVVGVALTLLCFPVQLVTSNIPLLRSALHFWSSSDPL